MGFDFVLVLDFIFLDLKKSNKHFVSSSGATCERATMDAIPQILNVSWKQDMWGKCMDIIFENLMDGDSGFST